MNIRNPRLKSLTLPNISDSLPTVTSITAVTIIYPIRIHKRYTKDEALNGFMSIPLKIAGSEISIMVPFIDAIRTPSVGRLSDIFGRVRLFNLGFLIFTVGSVLLYLTPSKGDLGAQEIIIFRMIQAIGASFLFANSHTNT